MLSGGISAGFMPAEMGAAAPHPPGDEPTRAPKAQGGGPGGRSPQSEQGSRRR